MYNVTMKKYLLGVILTIWGTWALADHCVGDTTSHVVRTVYVVPQTANAQLYVRWLPILEKVGQETGQCFELYVPASIPEFEAALHTGQADYAYMNPYHQVMTYKSRGYIPLVADSKNLLDGIIVVRKDSKIKSIQELNNANMLFPAPNAFAASLLIRSTLADQNILVVSKYVTTHSNVYRGVILGDAPAGGGINNTFDRETPAVKDKLRILYRTKDYTSHPFSANPRIAPATRDAVARAFVQLGQTESGQAMLDRAQMPVPRRVTYADYAPLEKLKLERFVQRGNN